MKSVSAVLLILALASTAMGAAWIGLATGVTIGIAANLQNSNNARQNMVGGIAGAVGGYLLTKTLKHDWHRRK